ncbi:hypothetical protein NP233_g7229 [Leucocoprinus birnbaumii]|uniref:GmrSD restriction endonucleases N-terminal domain-containing protein n=1 Tax=Leucocoprinus birnbaumii TaxID=56174 RepID=A0AAD5VPN0_9AGAR|nr:hypothetical protein NP233_g7229 [Leucocoprinus birnbaumii]
MGKSGEMRLRDGVRAGCAAGGTKKGGKKGKKDKAGRYHIKDALKSPKATTYTAQVLFGQIVSGDIDLDPEYQRDVYTAKQVGLIDSIFRNFYIPPVIFAVSAHDDGSKHRICIDGNQRLTAIYRFMLGLVYRKTTTFSLLLATHLLSRLRPLNGRKTLVQRLLHHLPLQIPHTPPPKNTTALFSNKQIVCVEYMDIGDKDEREIFQRVQLGMALTPAEKLGVVKSPCADFIRHLQSTFFKDSDSALTSLAWDRSRAGFTTLQAMLTSSDPAITLPFQITTAELGQDTGGLAKAIIEMRRQVRSEHVNVRMNTRIGKTMITFIKDIKLEDYKTEDDGETEMSREDGEVAPVP